MILFPYKKVVIETEMNEEAFLIKLEEISETNSLFNWGYSDEYFLGGISQNRFDLIIAYEDHEVKKYKSFHRTKIKGEMKSNKINLKMGYGIFSYIYILYIPLFSYLFIDEFAINFKTIFILILTFLYFYQNVKGYSYYKLNCIEIERKFLEISEGKIIDQ